MIVLSGAVASPVAAKPRIEAQLLPGGLVTPRERPVVRARVWSSASTRVRLRLAGPSGHPVGRSRLVRIRAHRRRTIRVKLGEAGARLLGRCGTRRVTLVVRTSARSGRRVRAETTADPVRCAPLRWPAPPLESPQTIDVGDGFQKLHLQANRDYVLRLPRGRKLGGTFVEGGRNVVIVGGYVSVPRGTTDDEERRALYFKDQTGTVHIEGVLIDSAGGEGDGIAINAPQAVVQVENVRIAGLRGSQSGTHADLIQPWGGVRELRVDRMTGTSRFQGLELPLEAGPIGAVYIRDTDLRALPPITPAGRFARGGGHMLWLTQPGSCRAFPLALEQVYLVARPGRTVANSVWPPVDESSSPCAAVVEDGAVGWPRLPVRGVVRPGVPRGGDFVPRWNVGDHYRSPGYLAAGTLMSAMQTFVCRTVAGGCAPR